MIPGECGNDKLAKNFAILLENFDGLGAQFERSLLAWHHQNVGGGDARSLLRQATHQNERANLRKTTVCFLL